MGSIIAGARMNWKIISASLAGVAEGAIEIKQWLKNCIIFLRQAQPEVSRQPMLRD